MAPLRPHVKIGAHPYTPRQEELLQKAGISPEPVVEVKHVSDVNEVVKLAKEHDAVIVVQALPLPLMLQLLQAAGRAGVEVYRFEMEPVTSVKPEERCPPEADAEHVIPSAGIKRCMRTKLLKRIKRLIVQEEAEPVAE